MTPKLMIFIKAMVQAKMNILVAGGTGNGKTTFVNLLLNEVAPNQRVIIIEDTKELATKLPNVVRLVSSTMADILEDQKMLTIQDLVRNTLRMRHDRIIIGEVRGAEAFDLLQAVNTGHQGSMCTIHANSPESA